MARPPPASSSFPSSRSLHPVTSLARQPQRPAPAARAVQSSSSIYDNDDELERGFEEYFAGEEGGEAIQGVDEFGWNDGAGNGWTAGYEQSEPSHFRFLSPPSPSPTRPSAGQQQQQHQYERTLNYYAAASPSVPRLPASAAGPSQVAAQAHSFRPQVATTGPHANAPQHHASGLIQPMPLRMPAQRSQQRQPQQQGERSAVHSSGINKPYAPPRAAQQSSSGSYDAQQALGGVMSVQGEEDDDDEQYWRDDAALGSGSGEWEHALLETEFVASGDAPNGPSTSRIQSAVPRAARSNRGPQHDNFEKVAYLEDLEPPTMYMQKKPVKGGASREGTVQKQGIKLRPVSELPDMFRSLWRFGVFNAVQSVCFDTVFHKDENVVISAPTGAGKTVLFELAIIRLFTKSPSSDAKVLYMAPTKSLCSERTHDWKRKFEQGLGWTVQELTGDSDLGTSGWRDVAHARIIVTTPEKWDSMTRKWHDHGATLSQLHLLCVDEVHTVGTDVRGATLEVVVSRMKTLGTDTRFVAVSATVPNIDDVAEWLGSGSNGEGEAAPATVLKFGDEFRPCKLQKIVVGYPKSSNDFAFANSLNFKLYDLVKQYASGKPVVVFCNTRKSCSQAAEALAKDFKQALSSSSTRSALAWPKPRAMEYKTSDKNLSALLENGIAVHHAGMDVNDRRLVEKLFIDGGISIVCSTSTLAVGVNLPARMVIIRGTKGFVDGQNKEYSDLEILQMIGRAGRPQYDSIGVACIMTEKALEAKYSNLVNAQNLLESCLHKSLTEHVNSEISLRTITDVESGLLWLRSTFLYARITKNPSHYALGSVKTSPEARLEEICVDAIKELVDSGVVDKQDSTLVSNQLGEMMSKFCVSHKTFLSLKDLPLKSNMRALLQTIANATEFSQYRFRQGEKSVFQKYNKNLKFPLNEERIQIMILIQLVLEGIPGSELRTDHINPMLDARGIFACATRIVKCMVELAVEREDGAIRTALELSRSLQGRCWDSSSFVLRQLEGIGEKSYKILTSNGLKSFEDIRNTEPDRLEVLLSRKPPYGRKLIAQATALPQFEIVFTSVSEQAHPTGSGVQVDLSVDLRLKQTKPLPTVKKGAAKLWASIATTTSDGEFIECDPSFDRFDRNFTDAIAESFRRMRLDRLLTTPKQFDVAVILVKPSQRIIVSASCEVLAGTEVKAVFKPATKASEFPIPTLGSVDDEAGEMGDPQPAVATPSTAANAAVKAASMGPFGAVSQQTSSTAPPIQPTRRRGDGKFECNHSCGNKASCKHLCCRDGLDKPPVRRNKSKAAADGASTKSSKKSLSAAAGDAKRGPASAPLRIQPAPSAGVALARTASGKIVSQAKHSATQEAELPSLEALMAAERSKPRRKSGSLHQPPTVPTPRAADGADDEAITEIDELESPSPSPPTRSTKRKQAANLVDAAAKRRRVSLREFASSSPIELPDTTPALKIPRAIANETLLRPVSPTALFAPLASPRPLPQEAQHDQAFDDLAFVDHPVEADPPDEHFPPFTWRAQASPAQFEEAAVAHAEPAAHEAAEDDFDAWMAESVVVV
ncbi:DNA helicase [Rhodotorula paludigena]|uniref:DNA helicase n=1 Tax=Rhodotorula paludigena TaxID=86838 RepID=UPI00317C7C13